MAEKGRTDRFLALANARSIDVFSMAVAEYPLRYSAMSVEQLPLSPAPIDDRQQMMLQARAHTIGHCESRLVDFRAWGRAFLAYVGCNVLGGIVAAMYIAANANNSSIFAPAIPPILAYLFLIVMNFISFPVALAAARGAYTGVLQRYRQDREAAGLADI